MQALPSRTNPEATDAGASHSLCTQGRGQLPGLPCLSEGTAQGLQAQQHPLGESSDLWGSQSESNTEGEQGAGG